MTKIKREKGVYFAFADYCERWYPFWDNDIPEDLKKNKDGEYETEKEVSFTNCGLGYKYKNHMSPCSGLWPNSECINCGGYGVGARL